MKVLESAEFLYKTTNIFDDEEAIARKMKQIHPKLFGVFCPVKYELVKKEKVYVPYDFMRFNYKLIRGDSTSLNKRGIFDREGEVAVVYDLNEAHAFHFDLFDDLDLRKKSVESIEGIILKPNCSKDEALQQSIECVKWQYLRKVFHAVPQITLLERTRFYREAWKLTLSCRGKTFEKFAWQDKFGAENEHITGLRVRLST